MTLMTLITLIPVAVVVAVAVAVLFLLLLSECTSRVSPVIIIAATP